MQLNQLVKDIVMDGVSLSPVDVTGICTHSADVTHGSLFVAIYGKDTDGHDFIPHAIKNGASAIISNGRELGELPVPNIKVANPRLAASRVAAEYYGHPTKELTVIGITGTNGKTTTASILNEIMKSAQIKSAQLGTLGIIAEGYTPEKTLTTPDPIHLQKTFRELLEKGFTHIIMEVSSHALDQHRVADVHFNIGAFTNLSPEHLDYHHSMDDYFHAKTKLFHSLPITGTAIVNFDDELGQAMARESQAPVVSMSKQGSTDIYFSDLSQDLNGIHGTIIAGEVSINVSSPLLGEFNAENILCAVSMAVSLGIHSNIIQDGISKSINIPGRMESFQLKNGATVVVDYAHTTDAYTKVLTTVQQMMAPKGKMNIVFGCGGDRDATKRSEMGRIAEQYSDQLWVTPDNPRSENINEINDQILMGISGNNVEVFDDRSVGLNTALSTLNDEDVLVVLGKGRETYQEIKGEKIPYSDVKIIEEFIHAN
ncbi:MAG: UDP-N-acetylmuramoyl-L-alanyl-D-glutamate--2,6-diaminopimelate ligase [Candidatus Marinimicrobia bacterium]|jgi:UDP-N-acetylmuramoyl-L-alanyl-D-glutamate--2,6-diaminopimelate ligase|nr:UDP-N-acetylmuramoyl-L-alanyl-D-glutamate--2,6-diaminopimelate ligase [Candidatus Neomarinimicrobiota bacterium]MBT4736417.1 UDP-N-acetylmuramoyl-L-alanyl-D-glutamate--2,6-diaminopimelate ligase [Candidatus Neomarinimicrobiota bacterium]MBT5386963.1 UDP-N-acetylmuramoyl-L-alanyl-D-glutamate--2,6-diaminopimelate ligase [Candidatus Neomarinimicrobiota bacterium]MBT5994132.1 UDP-N-acetylmuramoyl-L-alanyl-D-glutamate--2,6-diaminopimelate ligase [Candidatus Neomarinimicrobiota bacterium]MBT678248|tara:strand:- start:8446 stop:9897 length:1452 start_codon:yes stop_codon:yes gene_type:complete